MSAMFRSRILLAKRKSFSFLQMATRTSGNSGNGLSRSGTTGLVKSSTDAAQLEELQQRLGYRFSDTGLLALALTHSSIGPQYNERLEFLGDRVLGLIVAEKLYDEHPSDDEGRLAVRFNALVRRDACARAARLAGLAPYLIMANSESGSGGRNKSAILADTCEAVIAALYLDGG